MGRTRRDPDGPEQEPTGTPQPTVTPQLPPDTLSLVAVASQGQANKVREVLDRLDTVAELDPRQVQGIASLLRESSADGGCGIGCW